MAEFFDALWWLVTALLAPFYAAVTAYFVTLMVAMGYQKGKVQGILAAYKEAAEKGVDLNQGDSDNG